MHRQVKPARIVGRTAPPAVQSRPEGGVFQLPQYPLAEKPESKTNIIRYFALNFCISSELSLASLKINENANFFRIH